MRGLAFFAVIMGSASVAHADGIAAPCDDDAWTCRAAPVSFDKKEALPIEWQFDTGWIPPSSPLQVHLWGLVAANTRVALAGWQRTSWPDALTLSLEGEPGAGLLSYHYGVDVGAQGAITVEILGVPYSWTGDLPYIPQIDFQVEASQPFDPWAFAPGITASDSSEQQTVAQINLLSLSGFSIPGVEAGFQLDIALDLDVTYRTDRLVMATPEGVPVAGGDIVAEGETSFADYAGGPFVELDVHPEGTVTYDGVLHLFPTLYVEVLGTTQTTQLADVPVDLPAEESAWIFEAQRVHVPLPDLQPESDAIDFGERGVDTEAFTKVALHNDGEATLLVEATSDDDAFVPEETSFEIEPGEAFELRVWFLPTEAGEHEATLALASNDPDEPLQTLALRGGALEDEPDDDPNEEPIVPEVPPFMVEDSSCACRSAPAASSSASWWILLLLPLVRWRRRA
jgi:hypothetical protein